MSTSQSHSLASSTQGSLEYHPLSFENKLFMSKVYLRNSRNMMIKRVFKIGNRSRGERRDTAQPLLNWEAIRNELDADSLLLSSQEISIKDNETIKPYMSLVQACEQGNSVQANKLLVGGIDVHARLTGVMYSGYTAIHVAALYGHVDVVEILLKYSANIDEEDLTGKRRPLHFAAGGRQRAMVKFLIQKGAQIDAKACNAVQPIHEASWSGSIEILDALIEAGADISCPDRLGYKPSQWAVWSLNQSEVIRYLSNKKRNVEPKLPRA